MQVRGLPELADESVIAHWRAAHRLSCWLTRPAPGVPGRHPGHLGLRWEAITCPSRDGLRLTGWVVEPRRARATILLFHPLRQNRERTLEWAHWLAAKGCRSLAIDFRAHGESEGWRTSFGWWERQDVLAAADLAAERWPRQPLAAIGLGLGAAALCYTGGDGRFDAVVLHAMPEKLNRVLEAAVAASPAPVHGFLNMVRATTERRLRVRLDQLAPAERLADLSAPVLVQPEQSLERGGAAVWEFLERWLR